VVEGKLTENFSNIDNKNYQRQAFVNNVVCGCDVPLTYYLARVLFNAHAGTMTLHQCAVN